MGEFLANVKAVLDLSGIQGQIKQIESTPVTLSNIAISQSALNSLQSQIQNAINNGNYSLGLNNRSFTRQLRQAGDSAGDNYIGAFNRRIRTMQSVSDDVIGQMQTNLRDRYSFGDDDIARVTRNLDKMNLAVTRIRTSYGDNDLRMSVSGIDEFGEAVEYITTYNRETGELTSQRKNITQTFDSGAASVREFNSTLEAARNAIGSNGIGATIGNLNKRFNQLGSTGHAMLSGVGQDLDELRRISSNMASTTSDDDLVNYYDSFNRIADRARNNLDIISSDTSPLKQFEKTLSRARSSIENGGMEASIAKLNKQFSNLGDVDPERIGAIKQNLGELDTIFGQMKNQDGDALVASFEQAESLMQKTQNAISTLAAGNRKMLTDTDILAKKNGMLSWLDKNSKAAKKYGNDIKALCDRYDKLDITQEDAVKAAKSIDDAYKGIKQKAIAEGLTGKSLFDQLKDIGKTALGFISVYDVVQTATRGFKEMYQAVYDIDTAMTNLKKVTDESESSYASFLDRSTSSAQELGRTVSSLVEQTASWSKLGYSLNEAEQLSKLSSIYANVAEVSDETAVSDIVTALKAYGLETQEASRVVDSLNELGKCIAHDNYIG